MDLADRAEAVIAATCERGRWRARLAMLPRAVFDCDGCGDAIDPERKAAMPAARRCVECQVAVERAARQSAGRAGGTITRGAR